LVFVSIFFVFDRISIHVSIFFCIYQKKIVFMTPLIYLKQTTTKLIFHN